MKRFTHYAVLLILMVVVNLGMTELRHKAASAGDCPPGDVNGSGTVALNDALYILNYLFLDGDAPIACAGDGPSLTDDEIEFLQGLAESGSIEYVEDPDDEKVSYKTIVLSECNLQVVNGLGATNGWASDPRATSGRSVGTNGLGNLIVGYNEIDERDAPLAANSRSGSHNIVVGTHNDYSSFGSILGGTMNSVEGPWSSVLGGERNSATGNFSTIAGGRRNTSSGSSSVVSGGDLNEASGSSSSVTSGVGNDASGVYSAVSGGSFNDATESGSSVTGGAGNNADGFESTVTGGLDNTADGSWSVVSGGNDRGAEGTYDWVAGTLEEDD